VRTHPAMESPSKEDHVDAVVVAKQQPFTENVK
jgi:hypothetical protein